MKKIILILMIAALSVPNAFAMARTYKAPTNVDSFYVCLGRVVSQQCDASKLSNQDFYACYKPARAKCGCDNNIAAECK